MVDKKVVRRITLKVIVGTAQAGWIMAYDAQQRPILARLTPEQALADAREFLRQNPTSEMKVCGVVYEGVNEPQKAN